MIMVKLIFLILVAIVFFGLFVFGPLYPRLGIQVGMLILVALVNIWRTSWRETWGLVKFCIPFVLTLLGFGILFHFTHFLGRDDWLQDSAIKVLIFPSSLIFLKLLLTFVTYLDILRLPVATRRRVDLITFKAALSKGGRIMRRFKWYLDTYQELSGQGQRGRVLRKYVCLIIALYLYL